MIQRIQTDKVVAVLTIRAALVLSSSLFFFVFFFFFVVRFFLFLVQFFLPPRLRSFIDRAGRNWLYRTYVPRVRPRPTS